MSIHNSKNILKDVTIGDISGDFHVGDIIHLHFTDGTEKEVPLSEIKDQLKEDLLIEVIEITKGKEFFEKIAHALKKPPKYLTNKPFPPELFLGRKDDIQAVHNKLFNGENLLLLVNGRGGIGKTTFASQYYYQFYDKYTHLAWVFAEKSLLEALLILAIPLQLTFEEQMPNETRLQELLKTMGELDKPCLLVVDNANELDELEKYHPALKSCPNFHVLLTTRVTELNQPAAMHPLGTLGKVKAKEVFTTHYKAHRPDEDDLLEQLLEAVGYNTLVIELLAKNLNNFNNRLKKCYPLPDLLKDLSDKGKGLFGIESKSVQTLYQAKDLQMRKETPEDILEAMYELNDLADDERQLLSVFSILPAEAIFFEKLEVLLPELENMDEPLLSLAKKGWLEYDEQASTFKISPVIQEVIRKRNEPLLWEDTRTVLSQFIDKLAYVGGIGHFLNATYEEAALWVSYAGFAAEKLDTWMTDYLPEDSSLPILYERIGNFYSTTGNLPRAKENFEACQFWDRQLLEKYPDNVEFKNNLAISYSKLGSTHSSLGNLSKALEYYEKDLLLAKELYAAYPDNVGFKNGLAISYSKLGETHSSLGNLSKALEFFEQRSQLGKELYAAYPDNVGFKNGLAISYLYLGQTFEAKEQFENAKTNYQKGEKLYKELVKDFPQNGFQNNLAWVEKRLKALE